MSKCACSATFSLLKKDVLPCSPAFYVDREHPDCSCEHHSVSDHSPGPVESDEMLIRILVAPQHMKNNGKPKAAALSDAERNGLSSFREKFVTDHELRSAAEQLVERARAAHNTKAGVFGVLRLTCAAVKSCQDPSDKSPCYCVYDTALEEVSAHTEIFQRVSNIEESCREL